MTKIEKNNKLCYNKYNRKVDDSMMYASNYIENIIYNDDSLKAELNEKKKKNGLMSRLQMLLLVKNIRSIYHDKSLKFYTRFERNKDILNGKTVIKGTRITPETIVSYVINKAKKNIDNEDIFEQLLNDYPSITKEDISASFIYAIAKMSYFKVLFCK